MFNNKKLTIEELRQISSLLRGRRAEIAQRANVSTWTVNNTFQNLYQNPAVIEAAKEMIKEQLAERDPVVEEIRQLITVK